MSRHLFVFKTHIFTQYIYEEYHKLCSCFGKQNIFITFDDTHQAWSSEYEENLGIPKSCVLKPMQGMFELGPGVLLIHDNDMKQYNEHHKENKLTYETTWCILHRMLGGEHAQYDYMWSIENDVYCNGDWSVVVDKCKEKTCDLLAYMIGTMKWPDSAFERIYGWDIPRCDRINAFCAICRLSKRLVEVMDCYLGERSGFLELYPPTLCKSIGYKIDNFPEDVIGIMSWHQKTKKWMDEEIARDGINHKLYHSVKM
jgi:hypothetical protein